MKDFTNTRNEILKETGSDASAGLSAAQVQSNLELYGSNVLTREKPVSLLKRIIAASAEPMILMLIAAWVIALIANAIRFTTGGETDFLEVIGIFGAIALSVAITVMMEGRSAKAFETLAKINDDISVKVIRDGNVIMVPQNEIVVGDIVQLAAGDKIPADGRLLESTGLDSDESALTGESVPAKKDAEAEFSDEKTPLAERRNMLYSGNYITNGFGKMVVTAVGDNTDFGKIARELAKSVPTSTPLQEKMARLGKTIAIFGTLAAVIVFIVQIYSFYSSGTLTLDTALDVFLTSIVLIVAAVPEGLPTIMAVSLSITLIKLSRQNALVKKIIATETIGSVNVICSDKTGTLTENKMTVVGFYDDGWSGNTAELSSSRLVQNISLNTTADLAEDGSFIGNPTEGALLVFYEHSKARSDYGKSYRDIRSAYEIIHTYPFSSELKRMTTIVREGEQGEQIISYTKGSPEFILEMCNLSEEERENAEKQIRESQEKAMRIIAFAHKELDDLNEKSYENNHGNNYESRLKYFEDEENRAGFESGMTFDGFVSISDPLRADVYDAVLKCRSAGIDVKMLTGDNIITAEAIANQLHMLDGGKIAVEAKEIADISDEELTAKLPQIAVIARSTPTIKMRVVNLLKGQGNVVAVTGDGINDAPALKNADVGIAMGIAGTEVSKEASDIVLLNDSFSTIVQAVRWGRGIYENFKRFIQFQLTANVASVVVVLVSVLLGLKAPFTALQLLWINIIMDGPPALTLGLEPADDDLMERKPTKRSENIISKEMLIRIGLTGLFISAIVLGQYLFNFLGAAEAQVTTVLFAMLSLFLLFNAFNCRELHAASIFKNFFRNKIFLVTISITFVLQILAIQYAGAFFGTIPLPFEIWLKILAVTASIVLVSEVVKFFIRLFIKVKRKANANDSVK
ncbi:MAG: calcium-translocating P-type ATPase, PMCA-type [Methanosarcinales archaeon]|jgi:Ca2+-transporting ATPase|nr:calcium-translocating P-type ATPase, PMCA-type [Methanosarcinales archaeon]